MTETPKQERRQTRRAYGRTIRMDQWAMPDGDLVQYCIMVPTDRGTTVRVASWLLIPNPKALTHAD